MKKILLFGVLGITGLSGCLPIGGGCRADWKFERDIDREDLDAYELQLIDMVGDGSCENEESCSTVAIGAKPCGGPWSYLVYCADNVDEEELLRMADEYAQMERDYNIANELSSDCSVEEEPMVALEDGVCVAVDPE